MRPSDKRLGNYLYYNKCKSVGYIIEIHQGYIVLCDENYFALTNANDFECFKQIPLTEDWLIKFV